MAACGATPAEEEGVAATTGVPATTSTETPTPSTSVRRDVVSTGELHVIVTPDENGEYPPDLIVTCPHGPRFPLGALDRIAPISDDDPDGMLAAIAVFLDSEEGAFWPQEGWQLLHQGAQEAILVSRFEPGLAFVFLDKDQNAWVWGGSSIPAVPCDLQYTVPAGLHHVEWRLDPSVPDPGPHDTELRVVLTESACVSGQKIGDRLLGPQTVITATRRPNRLRRDTSARRRLRLPGESRNPVHGAPAAASRRPGDHRSDVDRSQPRGLRDLRPSGRATQAASGSRRLPPPAAAAAVNSTTRAAFRAGTTRRGVVVVRPQAAE